MATLDRPRLASTAHVLKLKQVRVIDPDPTSDRAPQHKKDKTDLQTDTHARGSSSELSIDNDERGHRGSWSSEREVAL